LRHLPQGGEKFTHLDKYHLITDVSLPAGGVPGGRGGLFVIIKHSREASGGVGIILNDENQKN
jgi:hypothetical protein